MLKENMNNKKKNQRGKTCKSHTSYMGSAFNPIYCLDLILSVRVHTADFPILASGVFEGDHTNSLQQYRLAKGPHISQGVYPL